jgi:predicted metal-dependent peptidase
MSSVDERLDRAQARLLLSKPWWASLLLHLDRVLTDRVPFMATDGTRLLLNPEFVATLKNKEIEGLLCHAVAHCALLHPYRRGTREPRRWNIAADAAANALLIADGVVLPTGYVPPADTRLLAEEIYEGVRDEDLPMADLDDGLPEEGDSGRHGNQMTARDWSNALAAMRGIEPGGISRIVNSASEPLADWRRALALFASATVRSECHTWSRLSRRVPLGAGRKREPQSKIAICIDSSGSVDDGLLSMFCTEARAICAMLGIEAWIIAADAVVSAIYKPGDTWHDLPGGGGTDFRPALHAAVEHELDAAIYLTDGDGEYGEEPPIPTLWAMPPGAIAPYGQTITLTHS